MIDSSAPPFANRAAPKAAAFIVLLFGGCTALPSSSPQSLFLDVDTVLDGTPPGQPEVARSPTVPSPENTPPSTAPAPPEPMGAAPRALSPFGDRPKKPEEVIVCGAGSFSPPLWLPPSPEGYGTRGKEEGKEKETTEETDKDKEKEEKAPGKKKEPWYSIHEQGTIVTQAHGSFRSPYIGINSLQPNEHSATTETATLFLDARVWPGGEIVFNPEISGGRGFSGTTGLAGFPNGEATRTGVPQPTPYIARLFFRQTWGFDVEREKVEDAPNQIAGVRDKDRFSVSVGKMAATDGFDNNRYSHDPRLQLLNWSLMYTGAWDYPANVRGYTYGVALDFTTIFYAVRYGIFAEPSVANGAPLDPHFLKANGQILELEESYTLGDYPGKVRQWAFLNHAHMGNYRDALERMPVNPDITLTRAYRFKYGFGANVEQELTKDVGVFTKIGWNDGQSETWAFTEIDRTLALGLMLKGRCWKRPQDEVGLAAVINGLSRAHRDYLRAGGAGFIIGDGRLNYAAELIVETYYNWELAKGINVTADVQAVNHPAYNADRGPVAIGTLRVHFEH